MRFILPLLSLGYFASAAVIPVPSTNANELDTRASSGGYRSVAYFVNWVSLHSLSYNQR